MAVGIDVLNILTQAVLILVLGIGLKVFSDKTKTPFVVLLILAGTILKSLEFFDLGLLTSSLDIIRVLALVIIVFSAGFYLKIEEIRERTRIILLLSTLGLFITIAIMFGVSYWYLDLGIVAALMLAIILSGTDSAVLSSVLSKNPSKIETILTSESLFNTPLTVILPLIMLDYLMTPEIGLIAIPIYLGKFILLTIVGITTGVLGGYLGQKVLERTSDKYQEITGLAIALGVYVIAENLLGSGILAVAITSILLTGSQISETKLVSKFINQLALIFTIFVFVFLGLQFSVQELLTLSITRAEIITVIIAVFLARLITSLAIGYNSGLTLSDKLKIGLIAPKGLAPAALAPLMLPLFSYAEGLAFMKITYLSILLSILISLIIFILTVSKENLVERAHEKTLSKQIARKDKNTSFKKNLEKIIGKK